MKKEKKPKLIVILGQTSTGKSDFAVRLAKKMNGEIISADSRQIYRGLDLLSGKISKKEMRGVPHYLLDTVTPKKVFSVAEFQKNAARAIRDINTRGHIPFLVGGTGLYIDSVVSGAVLPEVPPNPTLRKKLYAKSTPALFAMLKKMDPARSKTIDENNKVRLVRAIEIATALGKVPKIKQSESPYDVLKIGLILSDTELKKRIHTRLLKRFKQGMLKEAQKLHASGISWKRMNELGLESRWCALHLQGKISKQEMLSQLEIAIWHYAKRQKTWFKRDKETLWLDPKDINRAFKTIRRFL